MEEKFFQSMFIKAICGRKSIIYGAIYRSQIQTQMLMMFFFLNLNDSLSKISPCCNYVTGGNFNYDLLNHEDKLVNRFIKSIYENIFRFMINKPNRITDTTATILDQIWTNTQFEEAHVYILVNSLADHLPVSF